MPLPTTSEIKPFVVGTQLTRVAGIRVATMNPLSRFIVGFL